MAFGDGELVDLIICVPQRSAHVPDRRSYVRNCREVVDYIHAIAADALPDHKLRVRLNARDSIEDDEIYLTLTGSSVERATRGWSAGTTASTGSSPR
jgi:S-adenosylmethionine synthetase